MTTTGARVLADSLVGNGIEQVLNITGLGMWGFVEAVCAAPELTYVTAVNESVLTLAADGYGRAAGKPAFANLYFSSGTALGLVGMSTAWADHVPLILATTTNDRRLDRRDGYAAVPERITEISRQYTKWSWEVPIAARLPEAISRAVTIATTAPMGPVHLGIPMDLYDEAVAEPSAWSGQRPALRGGRQADDAAMAEVAARLLGSARPLVLAGGQVGRSGAGLALARIAKSLGAAVVTQSGRVVSIPVAGAAWYAGPITENVDLFEQADVVLSIGFEFGEVPGGVLPVAGRPNLTVLELAESELDLGKHFPPALGVIGDLGASLARLAALIEDERPHRAEQPWAGDRGATNTARISTTIDQMKAACDGEAPVLAAVDTIVDELGARACIVDQSNFATVFLDAIVPRLDPANYFAISQKASAQGWGVPAGIGVQLARPRQRAVAIVGDGGFMFTSGALYTAARLKLPLIVVAVNNGGWGGGGYNYRIPGSNDTFIGAFDDPPLDLSQLAASLGVSSERVRTDAEAVAAARRAVAGDGPVLIEVMLPPSGMEMIRQRRTVWRSGMSG